MNDEHGHISGVSFSKGKGAESLLKLVELFHQNREALTNGVQYIDMGGHEILILFLSLILLSKQKQANILAKK